MKDSFQLALKEVLKDEGGYVNHPKDPGGATNKGITQATYDAFRSPNRSVKLITDDEVALIYKSRYWDAVKGDQLPRGLDYAVFDFAVNSGPSKAATYLQQILKVTTDGQIGPKTLEAAQKASVVFTINRLCDDRLAFLKRLPTWATFGKGWDIRVKRVRANALQMAYKAPVAPSVPPATPVAPLPSEPDTELLKTIIADSKAAPGLWGWLRSLFA